VHPIDNEFNKSLLIHEEDEVAVQLLRTSKQVNREGSEVFYGENQFRFWEKHHFLQIHSRISIRNFQWLKEITMSIPFAGRHLFLARRTWKGCGSAQPYQRIVRGASSRADSLANTITRSLLDVLANVPRLRRFNLVIPPDWALEPACRPGACPLKHSSPKGYIKTHLHAPSVWDDLKMFFQHRPDLEVTVIRMYWDSTKMAHQEKQERFMRKLRYRLGIWDQREAAARARYRKYDWEIPRNRTVQDPNDLSQELRLLFGEIY